MTHRTIILGILLSLLTSQYLSGQVSPPTVDFSCEENLFEESFENGIPTGWVVDAGAFYMGPLRPYSNNLAGWFIHEGPTNSPNTGPDQAFEGRFYAYCEGSGPITRGAVVTLTSPAISLSISADIVLSFHLNMHGPSATIAINVVEEGVITNVLAPVNGNIHSSNQWEEVHVDISAWRNKTIQVQFEAVKPSPGSNGDISIDAVRICGSFANLPTLSEWGVIILCLLFMIAGVVSIKEYYWKLHL